MYLFVYVIVVLVSWRDKNKKRIWTVVWLVTCACRWCVRVCRSEGRCGTRCASTNMLLLDRRRSSRMKLNGAHPVVISPDSPLFSARPPLCLRASFSVLVPVHPFEKWIFRGEGRDDKLGYARGEEIRTERISNPDEWRIRTAALLWNLDDRATQPVRIQCRLLRFLSKYEE